MMTKRRGFSLIELIVVIVILGILSSIGTVSYQAVQKKQTTKASTTLLQAAQGNARAIAAKSSYTYPADVVSKLRVGDITFGSAPATSQSTISAQFVNKTTLVLTTSTGSACTVLVDRTDAKPNWGIDLNTNSCSAASAASIIGNITSIDYNTPSAVDF